MIAALICTGLAALLVGLNGAEGNWASLAMCLLGLWFWSGDPERRFARWEARRATTRRGCRADEIAAEEKGA